MEHPTARLEDALARTEADTEAALKVGAALTSQLKRAKKAAALGSLRDLERELTAAGELAETLRDSVRGARAGWQFDDQTYFASGAFAQELLAAAEAAGVRVVEQDDRLVSYPSLVRVLAADAAIEVDRRRQRAIRPSVVVASLKASQVRPPRFAPERFLETLLRAYRLVLAEKGKTEGSVAKVVDVHRVLTLLPPVSYTKQEFARDLHLLDDSGVTQTKGGLRLSFAAATGTKGASFLAAVTRSGELKPYYGIAFR